MIQSDHDVNRAWARGHARFLFFTPNRDGAKKVMQALNKAKAEAQEMNRSTRKEMSRHAVDISEVQVSCAHGVIHLHGRVRPMRGHEETFETDANAMLKALRQRPGIRDVIAEWTAIF